MPNQELPRTGLLELFNQVADGRLTAAEARTRAEALLGFIPSTDLGFARIDNDREARQGFPEVVFGQGKTPGQIAAIAAHIAGRGQPLLVTRTGADAWVEVAKVVPDAVFHQTARIIERRLPDRTVEGDILIAAAGTSDIPVAEEAAVSAEVMGHVVERLYDVGVAGLHRLLAEQDRLRTADMIIVVAGMEGALASVVGGLVSAPVVAVPTSVGYGASFGGLAALLAMLNSCASGVAVVNIDNGYGAAAFASAVLRHRPKP